jgi:hypothetical protein
MVFFKQKNYFRIETLKMKMWKFIQVFKFKIILLMNKQVLNSW